MILVASVDAQAARYEAAATSQAPTQLLQTAWRDARARGSVHEGESATVGKLMITFSDDVAAQQGEQDIHLVGIGEVRTVVVGGVAYFIGETKAVLVRYLGFPASVAATLRGRWVSVPRSSSAAYATVASDVTLSSALSTLAPPKGARLTAAAPSRLHGEAVVGIRAQISGGTKQPAASATLYVSTSSDPLPVEVDASSSQGHSTTVLSRWGERLAIKPPTGAIPLSTLAG